MAADRAAAQEMVSRSGQTGVPVILVDKEVIIGFDRARLERALAAQKPSLGIKVADASKRGLAAGAFVGGVRSGTAGERAGLQPGDVIIEIGNQAISSANDIETAISQFSPGGSVSITVLRGTQRLVLRAPLTP